MIEIFHMTEDLESVLKTGLKSPYQLVIDGHNDYGHSLREINNLPKESQEYLLFHSIHFFLDYESVKKENWVSILIDENDPSIIVGNMFLVKSPYNTGELYKKSIMNISTYLKTINEDNNSNRRYRNPFTAKLVNEVEAKKIEMMWKDKILELPDNFDEENIFQYQAEIIVPRLIIPPEEIYRFKKK